MGLYFIEFVFRLLDIRGDARQFGDYGRPRTESTLSLYGRVVARILAAFAATVVGLVLVLWATVWLALELL